MNSGVQELRHFQEWLAALVQVFFFFFNFSFLSSKKETLMLLRYKNIKD